MCCFVLKGQLRNADKHTFLSTGKINTQVIANASLTLANPILEMGGFSEVPLHNGNLEAWPVISALQMEKKKKKAAAHPYMGMRATTAFR